MVLTSKHEPTADHATLPRSSLRAPLTINDCGNTNHPPTVFPYHKASIAWNSATVGGFAAVLIALAVTVYPALASKLTALVAATLLTAGIVTILGFALKAILAGCARPTFHWSSATLLLDYLNPLHGNQRIPFGDIVGVDWIHVGFQIHTRQQSKPILLSAIYIRDWQALKQLFAACFPTHDDGA